MREWLVIENTHAYGVFAPDDAKKISGYIPRDVAEKLLGRKFEDGRHTWFSREDGEKMRAHPEWRTERPQDRRFGLGRLLTLLGVRCINCGRIVGPLHFRCPSCG